MALTFTKVPVSRFAVSIADEVTEIFY